MTAISTRHMIRKGIVSLDILPKLKDAPTKRKDNEYITLKGVQVKITSQRYLVFQDSLICYKCGLIGQYFAIEKADDKTNTNNTYHLNLYGVNEFGEEILITKDHLIPKSKGGKNHISNYKTCCEVCNFEKGDKL
jgi:Fe-S cluster assembly iron-binding protein IscA